jgi:hypothetical protein
MTRRRYPLVDLVIGIPTGERDAAGSPLLSTDGVVVDLLGHNPEGELVPLDATDLDGNPITSVTIDGVTIPPFYGPPANGGRPVFGRVGTGEPFPLVVADGLEGIDNPASLVHYATGQVVRGGEGVQLGGWILVVDQLTGAVQTRPVLG